jgi:hypothetical protein
MSEKVSFLEIKNHPKYKSLLFKTLLEGITNINEFESVLNSIVNEKYTLFNTEEFKGCLYDDDDETETLDLVLPSIRRVWAKIYTTPPSLLRDNRLELFQLYFDIDEFLDYLIDMLKKTKSSLIYFDKLDRTVETLTLIVDNYIAHLVEKTKECNDIDKEIASIKLQRERDIKINNIIRC